MKVEYNNLYTHFIFTTFLREALILNNNRERIEKYITGIVNNNGCQLYAIYANPEHVHFLVSRSPDMDEKRLAGIVANSSAFSVSKKEVDHVCKYILNQPEHHKRQTYMDEYDTYIKFYQKTINPK